MAEEHQHATADEQAASRALIEEGVDFYMVWTKTGRVPRYAHGYREAAEAEAKRLALLSPGKKFIVLHSVSKHSAPAPAVEAED